MTPKLKLKRELYPFQYIPKGYGIAYTDYARAKNIAYPIPLNLLIRAARKLYFWIKIYTPSQRDNDLMNSRNIGFQEGLEAGDARATERIHRQFDYELAKYSQERKTPCQNSS
jgi:hypothetical protein